MKSICVLAFCCSTFLAAPVFAQCLAPADSDGDGVANDVDLDDDNDGISDSFELNGNDYSGDRDCDGIRDYEDADLSSVSMPTPHACKDEAPIDGRCDDGVNVYYDDDRDGVPNHVDVDSDNDGIPDTREAIGTQTLPVSDADGDGRLDALADANHDGMDDRIAPRGITPADSDHAGVADPYESDSDGDDIFDVSEAGGVDWACSGRPKGIFQPDWDKNNDGMLDEMQKPMGGKALAMTDTDGDKTPDYMDLDSDGDGKPDESERAMKFCAVLTDTDGDGIPDFRDKDDTIPAGPVAATGTANSDGGGAAFAGELPVDDGSDDEAEDDANGADDGTTTRRGCNATGTAGPWIALCLCTVLLGRFRRVR